MLLRWGIQRGTSIIPKSTKVHRLQENINILDFNMTDEEMKVIVCYNIDTLVFSYSLLRSCVREVECRWCETVFG